MKEANPIALGRSIHFPNPRRSVVERYPSPTKHSFMGIEEEIRHVVPYSRKRKFRRHRTLLRGDRIRLKRRHHMKLKTMLCEKIHSASALTRHALLRVAAISFLAAQAIPNIASTQVEAAPPIAGVLGKVQSFTGSSLDVATASGVVHITVTQPFATYKQIP
jgi:hypothetical protein